MKWFMRCFNGLLLIILSSILLAAISQADSTIISYKFFSFSSDYNPRSEEQSGAIRFQFDYECFYSEYRNNKFIKRFKKREMMITSPGETWSQAKARATRLCKSATPKTKIILDDGPAEDLQSSTRRSNAGEPDCSGLYGGNPIDVASQNKYQREVDYQGPGRLPLQIVRTYNSNTKQRHSVFGPRWLDSNSANIYVSDAPGVKYISLVLPDGKEKLLRFVNNVWRDRTGVAVNITQAGKGKKYWRYTQDGVFYDYLAKTGLLQSVSEPYGERLTYYYNEDGSLKEVKKNTGQSLKYFYDKGWVNETYSVPGFTYYNYKFHFKYKLVTRIEVSSGFAVDYDYNADLLVTQATYRWPTGSHNKRYHYEGNNNHRLTKLTDENGNDFGHWEYNYEPYPDSDLDSRDYYGLAKLSYHGNNQERFEILDRVTSEDGRGRKVTTRNALGKKTTYAFKQIGLQWKITGVHGHKSGSCLAASQWTSYDDNGHVDIKTDWDGRKTDLDHDDYGRLIKETKGYGTSEAVTTRYEYETDIASRSFGKIRKITTPRLETTFVYGSKDRLKEKSLKNRTDNGNLGEVRTWTYSYQVHDNGIVKRMVENGPRTDVDDRVWTYYNSKGYMIRTGKGGHATVFADHNARGQAKTVTHPDGRVDKMTYHPRGWLLTQTTDVDGDARETKHTYDKVGQLTRTDYADGRYLTYAYDSAHRLTRITNALNETKQFSYDAASNVTAEALVKRMALFSRTYKLDRTKYDALSRVTAIIQGGNFDAGSGSITGGDTVASYKYNKNNQVTKVTNGRGHSTSKTYDNLNRLKTETDANGGVTTYWYNSHDQVYRIRDPKGNNTRYHYDGFGQLVKQESPDTGITEYRYDKAGNRIQRITANNIISDYTYDSLDRVTSEVTGSVSRSYEYDTERKGYLYKATTGSQTFTYTHNAHGELTQRIDKVAGSTFTTRWAYNKAGQVRYMRYPGGAVVRYYFDATGRTNKVTVKGKTFLDKVTYYPYGPIQEFEYANGAKRTYSRDTRYRLSQLESHRAPGKSVFNSSYVYDKASNITKITSPHVSHSKKVRTFSYDKLNRLSHKTEYGATQTFSYDKNGNRTKINNTVYETPSSSNRLSKYGSVGIDYDANGNITKQGKRNYSYNDDNRLVKYTLSGNSTTYAYDHRQLRTFKNEPGKKRTWFVHGENGQLLYERYRGSNRNYVYLNGELVGYVKDGSVYSVQSDHLGRPEVVNGTGKVLWQANNGAFHRTVKVNKVDNFNIGFPGQYWDNEKQSYYNWHRDYDPRLGRYLQSDPLGLEAGINTYAYVGSNPLKLVDPTGLIEFSNYGRAGRMEMIVEPLSQKQALDRTLAERARIDKIVSRVGNALGAGASVFASFTGFGLFGSGAIGYGVSSVVSEASSSFSSRKYYEGDFIMRTYYTSGDKAFYVEGHYDKNGEPRYPENRVHTGLTPEAEARNRGEQLCP